MKKQRLLISISTPRRLRLTGGRALVARAYGWLGAAGLAMLVTLFLPATAGAAGPAPASGNVGLPTLLLSSYSQAATGVTYTIGFIATHGLPLGSTVHLVAPSGTLFVQPSSYSITDDTTGGNCGPDPVKAMANKLALGCGGAGSSSIAPGDHVTITLTGVKNPARSGAEALMLSTTTNPSPIHLGFTLQPTVAVSTPSVELSSTSASATDVTYTVGFVTTDELWPGTTSSRITISAAPGTVFPATGGANFVNDDTAGGNCGPFGGPQDASGDTITLVCGGAGSEPIPAGQHVTVSISGVRNSSHPGPHLLSLSTSSDPKPVVAGYTLAPPTGVGSLMVDRSPAATDGSESTWVVGFTATNGWTYGTTITMKAPQGTRFPAQASDYCITDDGSDGPRCWYSGTGLVGPPGNSVTMTTFASFGNGEFTGSPVAAGDHVTVTIKDVAGGAGGDATVSTGADPVPVTVPIGRPGTPYLSLTSRSVGAEEVEYQAGFTATVTQRVSTVTLSFPAGTSFQTSPQPEDVVRDDSETGENTLPALTEAVSGTSITLRTSASYGQFTVNAGDYVTVLVYGVTNPSAPGSKQVTIATSLSRAPVALPAYSLVPSTKVTSATLSMSSTSVNAKDVTYEIGFTAADGLTFGGSYMQAPSTITISAPGTTFATNGVCDWLYNRSSGAHTGCPEVKVSGGDGSVTLSDNGYGQIRVPSGDQVTVFLYGVTAPATSGPHVLTVSTSSDPTPVPISYRLTSAAALTKAALWRTSTTPGAADVTYTIGFTATDGLQSGNDPDLGASIVNIDAASGTVFPSGGDQVLVRDDTWSGWNNDWVAVTGGSSALAVPASLVRPGDHVTVVIKGVHNPPGPQVLTVDTSSDVVPIRVG